MSKLRIKINPNILGKVNLIFFLLSLMLFVYSSDFYHPSWLYLYTRLLLTYEFRNTFINFFQGIISFIVEITFVPLCTNYFCLLISGLLVPDKYAIEAVMFCSVQFFRTLGLLLWMI